MSRYRFIILLSVVTLTLSACGVPWRKGAEAPRSSTAGQGTPDGLAVFQAHCAGCHTITDESRVGPGLAGLFERERLPNGLSVTEDNVRAWITRGGGQMPPQRLLAEELDALIAYLKTLE